MGNKFPFSRKKYTKTRNSVKKTIVKQKKHRVFPKRPISAKKEKQGEKAISLRKTDVFCLGTSLF
jgi:hypothetical protein